MAYKILRCLFEALLALFIAAAIFGTIVWYVRSTSAQETSDNETHITRPATSKNWSAVKHDQVVQEWFAALRQPDTMDNHNTSWGAGISCCGESDAYYADEVHVEKDGRVFAEITDDRDDGPLGRIHMPIGMKILVPPKKMIGQEQMPAARGNPTGHNVIFMGAVYSGDLEHRQVLCFVQGGGY